MTTLIKTLKRKSAFALAATAAVLPLSLHGQGAGSELAELKREFVEVKNQLEAVHEQAMQSDSVQEALAAAELALKSEMLALAPKKSDSIEAFFEARTEMSALDASKEGEKIAELKTELSKLGSKLRGPYQKASKADAVQSAQARTKDVILAAMEKIEPDTRALIKEQSELFARYQQLTERG